MRKVIGAVESVNTEEYPRFTNLERDAEWAAARRQVQLHHFYGQVPAALLQNKRIRPEAKALYALLHKYCPHKNLLDHSEVTVAKITLAEDFGVSEDRIEAWLNELKREGWIGVKRQGTMRPNKYTLWPKSRKTWEAEVAIKRVQLKVGLDIKLARKLSASVHPEVTP